MIDPAVVSAALDQAGVKLLPGNPPGMWVASFDVLTKRQLVFLFVHEGSPLYLHIASPITSPHLEGKAIEDLSAAQLREMVRASSTVALAKLHYQITPHAFLATSECSVEGLTGSKLRARMEACALLSAKLELALE